MSAIESRDPCAAGWPRRKADYTYEDALTGQERTERLPVPWISAPEAVADGYWLGFRPDNQRAHTERLCAVCGHHMEGIVVLGRYGQDNRRRTDGPGCHPRCMYLAAHTCPHFVRGGVRPTDDQVVAWHYAGAGLGYVIHDTLPDEVYSGPVAVHESCTPMTLRQLRALAQADPLGTSGGQPFCPANSSFCP